jgi:hypothetical protein
MSRADDSVGVNRQPEHLCPRLSRNLKVLDTEGCSMVLVMNLFLPCFSIPSK